MIIFKDSIQSQIYDYIRGEILAQNFKFDEQINPKKIAQDKGISVTPIRDALLQLSREGLVINRERVGFFVRNFSREDVIEIMEARKMYELYNLDEHFQCIDRDGLTEIYNKIKDPKIDKGELYNYDAEFHDLLIQSSKNQFLINEYERVKSLFVLFLYYDTTYDHEANEEHCRTIEAILNHDKANALDNLRSHLDRVQKVILDSKYFNSAQQ